MFEKEVLISGLRRSGQLLAGLVEEMASKDRFSDHDAVYCHEMIKKIENDLRRVRKMDEAAQLATRAW